MAKKRSSSSPKLENALIENLVELQRTHTNLAEKFDRLSDQISDLLRLFEMTARSMATHPGVQTTEKDKEFLDKIDKLLDQNKTIAKGLTLMEEKLREKIYGPSTRPPIQPTGPGNPKPLPKF